MSSSQPDEPTAPQPQKNSKAPIWVIVVAILVFLGICGGFGVSILATTKKLREHKTNRTQCPKLSGNQDMFGLGIRLGIYLQILTTALADIFGRSQKTALSLAPTTLWFLVAMFVALWTIIRDPKKYAVESYIIISLGNGITWILIGGATKIDPLTLPETFVTSFSRFLIWGLWRATSSYYWWSFKAREYRPVTDYGCGPWGWLLIKTRLDGTAFQTVHKVFNVLAWIALVQSIVPYFLGTVLFLYLLWTTDISDLQINGRRVSKIGIICDYMFVEIGELRRIIFGDPKIKPPGRKSDVESQSQHVVTPEPPAGHTAIPQTEPHQTNRKKMMEAITKRYKDHLAKHYKISIQSPIGTTQQGANAGVVNSKRVDSQSPSSNLSGSHHEEITQTLAPSPSPQLQQQSVGRERNENSQSAKSQSRTWLENVYYFRDKIADFITNSGLSQFPYLAIWDTCSIGMTILTVEFTLQLNNFSDVYAINSAGQLLGFVAGIGGAVTTAGNLYVEKRSLIIARRSPSTHGDNRARSGAQGFDARGKHGYQEMHEIPTYTSDMYSYPGVSYAGSILSFSQDPSHRYSIASAPNRDSTIEQYGDQLALPWFMRLPPLPEEYSKY